VASDFSGLVAKGRRKLRLTELVAEIELQMQRLDARVAVLEYKS